MRTFFRLDRLFHAFAICLSGWQAKRLPKIRQSRMPTSRCVSVYPCWHASCFISLTLRSSQYAAGRKRKESKNKPQEKEKGEAAMPSSLRRATVIMILLGVFLIPGMLQARTPARDWARVSRPAAESGFFSMVWNLLADYFEGGASVGSGGSFSAKNGGQMDPSGGTTPTPPSGNTLTGDNGGQMDPSGGE
jgi:hypothetical protein